MSQEIINSILQQSNPQEPVNIDELIKQSDQIQKEPEETDNIFDKISDIFTGTKRTEFASLPEIGEYKGEGAGATAVGLLLTPNQNLKRKLFKAKYQDLLLEKISMEIPLLTYQTVEIFI
jgi:hypothetical protein